MNDLRAEVSASMLMELQRASDKHGPAFYSLHEAAGVIWEEYEEAEANQNGFVGLYRAAWDAIKADNRAKALEMFGHCRERAIEAAMEWIQVAAMCHKAQREWEDR